MRLSGLFALCIAVAGSGAITALLAAAGEPQSVWLVCDLLGFSEVCR